MQLISQPNGDSCRVIWAVHVTESYVEDAGATAGRVVRFTLFFADYILFTGYRIFPLQPGHAASNSTCKCRRFLSIYYKSRSVMQIIGLIFYWASVLDFCFSFYWVVPALRRGGISATFGTINMACNSCTPLGPFTSKADRYVRFAP